MEQRRQPGVEWKHSRQSIDVVITWPRLTKTRGTARVEARTCFTVGNEQPLLSRVAVMDGDEKKEYSRSDETTQAADIHWVKGRRSENSPGIFEIQVESDS